MEVPITASFRAALTLRVLPMDDRIEIFAFHIEGKRHDKSFSCSEISIDILRECVDKLPRLILGSNLKCDKRNPVYESLSCRPEEGSIRFVFTILPAALALLNATGFESDLRHIAAGDIDKISDPQRIKLVRELDYAMRNAGASKVGVSSAAASIAEFDLLTRNFNALGEHEMILESEDVVLAEVEDLGGATTPNAHLLLLDSGEKVLAESDRAFISSIKENILYKVVWARVKYKFNVATKEKSDYQLIDLSVPATKFNAKEFEASLENYHTEWEEIDDPIAEIRRLRGGDV